ncbi:MAG TPA: FliA/WhiG family RNA polymerase sigma factor [Solirubrobacteraceae bacterium]|jgi:RNA polymerase sigma factor for flagellar operon FliA|nr:FliA/WhiG family RNA polymerase sigma factor [Solirubrobacteraceae bacterium]
MTVKERSGRLSAEETLDLWHDYRRTGDPRLRDRLVLTFAPMVKYIVYRKVREMPSHAEVDDFISCGLEALIRSIDRYDPDKGATLEQFAWTRIHGAVLDELRRNDWAPRSLRRLDREMGKARDTFFRLYGRRPTREELADALAITTAELVSRQDEIARANVGSLNILVNGEEDNATEKIDTLTSDDIATDPEHSALNGEAKERFRAAFDLLAPRERKIAVLLYVYNLTLREIGEILGVTESRVCQIHAQILRTLRAQLSSDEQLFTALAA